MKLSQNPAVELQFKSYPVEVETKLRALRKLVLDCAAEAGDVESIEETLKWGEPSYLSNIGSTIRMHWKASDSDHYRLYFICSTKLIDTFREVYGDTFRYESNRALTFRLNENLPTQELKHCCTLALRYHKIKKLPLLGA